MMLAVALLGILAASFVAIACIVGFSAWCRLVARNPAVPDDVALGAAAVLEGVCWPVTAWRIATGREDLDV